MQAYTPPVAEKPSSFLTPTGKLYVMQAGAPCGFGWLRILSASMSGRSSPLQRRVVHGLGSLMLIDIL